jgi:hypothetical protein
VTKFLGHGSPNVAPNIIKAATKLSSSSLVIPKDGPHPKLAVEHEFNFGRMEVGEKKSHTFTFRNEGAVPLMIENGGTTCQCTVSDMKLGEIHEIAPGKSFDVTLTWKPEVLAEEFSKGADFNTNEPDKAGAPKKVSLRAVGMVAPRMAIRPEHEWHLSNVTDEKPAVFVGTVSSPVADHFQIVSIASASPLLSFEVTPLTKEKMEMEHAQSGYEVRVTVRPEMPLGPFRLPMKIKTDLPGRNAEGALDKPLEFEILVTGMHRGPIQPFGGGWIDEKMAISLGAFDAAAGKKVRLPVFVKNPPEDGLKLTAAPVCIPAELKVDLEREERPNGKPARYFLNVEYPAGSPRAKHRDDDPARIRLQTNHPHGQNVEFLVFFSAY